ncbi:MAG: HD domain-containing protein [Candidatus Nanohaloarchaea archaeon]
MTHVKDALQGYIELDDEETQVIDSPEMQRLRRIQQLDGADLVYPSATHTRFQHSLGVMHLAGKFAESLDLDDERQKELRIAALLHDSGHGPFSHASELVAEKHGRSHEDFSCEVVDSLEKRYSVDPERVKRIIRGELEIGQVVAGDIDADRMDYLMRDAHSSGLEHGHIDADTIIRLAEIDSRRLVFSSKAVQALESLLTSRFHMYKTLYMHHTVVIVRKMLERALEDFAGREGVEELMSMDDRTAHTRLLEAGGDAEKLYSRVTERRLFKRALVWDEHDLERESLKTLEDQIDEPGKLEERIAEEAGVEPRHVIVDPPQTPEIQDINVKVKKKGEVMNLSELSPVPEALTDAEWRTVSMNVYTPEEHIPAVKEAASEVLSDYTRVLGKYID